MQAQEQSSSSSSSAFKPPRPSAFHAHRVSLKVIAACTFDALALAPYLTAWVQKVTGLPAQLNYKGHGHLLHSLHDPLSPLNQSDIDVNILLVRVHDLCKEICDSSSSSSSGEAFPVSRLAEAIHASAAHRGSGARTVVVVAPSPEAFNSRGILREQVTDQNDDWNLILSIPNTYLATPIHVERHMRRVQCSHAQYSPFLDKLAAVPFSPTAFSVLASELVRLLVLCLAPPRKVYALDCDGTLWGGAVAEVGTSNLDMTAPYLAVQSRFVSLQRRGALLCLCSRNELKDVQSALVEREEDMVLCKEHIVAMKVNWRLKSENLQAIADDLCLAAGAFLFVDDSPAECAEMASAAVRAANDGGGDSSLAAVGILRLPRESNRIESHLASSWLLPAESTLTEPTQEDLDRTQLYQQLTERKAYLHRAKRKILSDVAKQELGLRKELNVLRNEQSVAISPSPFLASLNLHLRYDKIDKSNAARAAQLTDRTSQHNACKRPISDLTMLSYAASHSCTLVHAHDRFGEHGHIGLMVIERSVQTLFMQPGALLLDSVDCHDSVLAQLVLHVPCWILSCRSLHLGIEHSMLRHAAHAAKEAGAKWLAIHWEHTDRNEPAAAFLFSLAGVKFVDACSGILGLKVPTEIAKREAATKASIEASLITAFQALKAAVAQAVASGLDESASTEVKIRTVVETICSFETKQEVPHNFVAEVLSCSLPNIDDCLRLEQAQKRLLTRWASRLLGASRAPLLARSLDRTAAVHVIRGRVGCEQCRFQFAGVACSMSDCPYLHTRGVSEEKLIYSTEDTQNFDNNNLGPKPSARTGGQEIQVSRYRGADSNSRPSSGYICVPVNEALASSLRLEPIEQGDHPIMLETQQNSHEQDATVDWNIGIAGIAFASKGKRAHFGLHHETHFEIAETLSQNPRELHEWIVNECTSNKLMPAPYAEVWDAVLRESKGNVRNEGQTAMEDEDAMHARLRRVIRHGMHKYIQQVNPDSYYQNIDHLELDELLD